MDSPCEIQCVRRETRCDSLLSCLVGGNGDFPLRHVGGFAWRIDKGARAALASVRSSRVEYYVGKEDYFKVGQGRDDADFRGPS